MVYFCSISHDYFHFRCSGNFMPRYSYKFLSICDKILQTWEFARSIVVSFHPFQSAHCITPVTYCSPFSLLICFLPVGCDRMVSHQSHSLCFPSLIFFPSAHSFILFVQPSTNHVMELDSLIALLHPFHPFPCLSSNAVSFSSSTPTV